MTKSAVPEIRRCSSGGVSASKVPIFNSSPAAYSNCPSVLSWSRDSALVGYISITLKGAGVLRYSFKIGSDKEGAYRWPSGKPADNPCPTDRPKGLGLVSVKLSDPLLAQYRLQFGVQGLGIIG